MSGLCCGAQPCLRLTAVRHARQVYLVIGIFGAARYGDATAGDILVNTWLGGFPEGLLDLAMGAYLSMSIPPISVCPSRVWMPHVPVFPT